MKRILILALFSCFSKLLIANPAFAYDSPLDKWKSEFKREAVGAGVSLRTLDQAIDGFQPIEKIIRLDRKQPEGTKSFFDYIETVVSEKRIKEARKLYKENKTLLDEVSAKYGLPPQYIVALWGIETSFGKVTGGFNVPHALATLAYDGRRAEFFRKELIQSLKIIDAGHISYPNMKGSWAGAMGQCQFMPSSFNSFAVDYDGDGKRDIWGTKADVFASIANYLSSSGWDKDSRWGDEVKRPKNFNHELEDIKTFKPLSYWKSLGLTYADGSALPESDKPAALMYPGEFYEGAYLVYDNFNVILKWNFSRYFGTAVGTLADSIVEEE